MFLPFLEQNFPHLAENYRQRYQDRAFLPPAYGKRAVATHRALPREIQNHPRRSAGNDVAYATKWPVQAFDEQLNLF